MTKRFCKEISGGKYELPTFDAVANDLLFKMYDKIKKSIESEVQTFDVCAVTTDGWLSTQHLGFLGLTMHYVNDVFQLVTRTISIENITGHHTGEALKLHIEKMLNKWNVLKKMQCLTTDNGIFYSFKFMRLLDF